MTGRRGGTREFVGRHAAMGPGSRAATARELLQAIPDALVRLSATGDILEVKPAALPGPLDLSGARVGLPLEAAVGELGPRVRERLTAVVRDHRPEVFQQEVARGGQVECRMTATAGGQVLLMIRDFTDRHIVEQALAHQAMHDALTGLPNRALFRDRLNQMLVRLVRRAAGGAVILVDLDNFKTINDTLGHDAGDRVLVEVAARLGEVVRDQDTVARIGGDEFAVLCEELAGEPDATDIAGRIAEVVARPMTVEDVSIQLTLSAGIRMLASGMRAEAAMRDADIAMYRAKDRGRARVEMFDASLRAEGVERLVEKYALGRAIERAQLGIEFQPVVSLTTGAVLGAEALLRWDHPSRGSIRPGEFMGLAETSGLIISIGRWAMISACASAARWTPAGAEPLEVSVNVSARELRDPGFPGSVATTLEASGLPPARLCIEFAESALLDDPDRTVDALHNLKALGVRLAIDDFGTGYSSLSAIHHLPIDELKIDGSFVAALGGEADRQATAVVVSIIELARALGVLSVAEGVETVTQARTLAALGCGAAQGYLFAEPMMLSPGVLPVANVVALRN